MSYKVSIPSPEKYDQIHIDGIHIDKLPMDTLRQVSNYVWNLAYNDSVNFTTLSSDFGTVLSSVDEDWEPDGEEGPIEDIITETTYDLFWIKLEWTTWWLSAWWVHTAILPKTWALLNVYGDEEWTLEPNVERLRQVCISKVRRCMPKQIILKWLEWDLPFYQNSTWGVDGLEIEI